jgi:hypothetical protein
MAQHIIAMATIAAMQHYLCCVAVLFANPKTVAFPQHVLFLQHDLSATCALSARSFSAPCISVGEVSPALRARAGMGGSQIQDHESGTTSPQQIKV